MRLLEPPCHTLFIQKSKKSNYIFFTIVLDLINPNSKYFNKILKDKDLKINKISFQEQQILKQVQSKLTFM